jgi:RNA polymerase sigma-70 factor (ECF subfamily)
MNESTDPYPHTRWTLVRKAGSPDLGVNRHALGDLYGIYNKPVYVSIRRRGYDHHSAQDLTQAYFVSLLEREYLSSANPEKGKFRAFIQKDLGLFLNNARRKENALRRGGTFSEFSIDGAKDDRDFGISETQGLDPELLLDREWAKATFSAALLVVERSYDSSERLAVFRALSPLLDKPATAGMYDEVALSLGMDQRSVKVAMHRLRERFGLALQQVIADTLANPTSDAIKEELRYLFSVLTVDA